MRLLSLVVILLAAACASSTPTISLSATPNPLAGDGETTATVTASVSAGGSPADGATVHFTTSLGEFKEAATGTPQLADVTTSSGQAVANLIAPRQGWGTISLTASVSLNGQEPKSSTTLALKPSGTTAASITFVCAHQNIGAFVQGRNTPIHVLCRATAYDSAGHVIPKASVQTLTEAGSLDWLKDDNGVQEFIYTVRPDDKPPLDVGPMDSTGKETPVCSSACNGNPFGPSCTGEPCWIDPTGIIHNPRDGVATLIAAVPGNPGAETKGEPFVDMNDNGTWDPGEPFIDYNGNGKWDANDGSVKPGLVWQEYRIIWSSEAAVTPTGGTGTTHDSYMTLASGGGVVAYFIDRNLNALAADGIASSDGIDWTGSCSGDGQLTPASTATPMDQINPGILFVAATGKISAPSQRSTWTRNIDYHNAVTFSSPTSTHQTCSVEALPRRQYDPGAPGYDQQVETTNPDVGLVVGFPF